MVIFSQLVLSWVVYVFLIICFEDSKKYTLNSFFGQCLIFLIHIIFFFTKPSFHRIFSIR